MIIPGEGKEGLLFWRKEAKDFFLLPQRARQ
jgi:hypothetical protein